MEKGSLPIDLVVFLIIILAVAISGLFLFFIYSETQEEIMKQYEGSNPAVNKSLLAGENVINMLDYFWIGLFIALAIGLAITSMVTDVHPAILGVFLLVGAIVITISAQFTNVYEEISGTTQLVNASNAMTTQNYVMANLPLIILIIIVIMVIILLAKPRIMGSMGGGAGPA